MLRNILLPGILFIISIATALAQTGQGNFYIGGSFSYDYKSYGSESTISYLSGYTNYYLTKVGTFSISPEIGYFLSDKWSIGIQPTFQRNSGTESSYYYAYSGTAGNNYTTDSYHTNIIGGGINIRYYAMINDKFGFFPAFGISSLNNATYPKYGTLNIGIVPNFVFFPMSSLGVNLGFGNVGYSLDYQTKDHNINAGLNNNITFGLNYYWGRR